jgi:hypothetical protein
LWIFSFCIQPSLSYLCTSLPTTATGWKPIAVNKFHYNICMYICTKYIIYTYICASIFMCFWMLYLDDLPKITHILRNKMPPTSRSIRVS